MDSLLIAMLTWDGIAEREAVLAILKAADNIGGSRWLPTKICVRGSAGRSHM